MEVEIGRILISSFCQFPHYQYSYHGWFQGTKADFNSFHKVEKTYAHWLSQDYKLYPHITMATNDLHLEILLSPQVQHLQR
jgi:hypothetical protein